MGNGAGSARPILPAWARKSPQLAEVLPLLYVHDLSTNDFTSALEQFLGTAPGLSAATINRLTTGWQEEAAAFNKRSLADTDYVYVWVNGIHAIGCTWAPRTRSNRHSRPWGSAPESP